MEKVTARSFQKVVVIGGSAGALDVLFKVLPKLKAGLRYPIVLVLHRKGFDDGALANLLASKSRLPVREVEDKDMLMSGTIFLAPGDYHLLLEADGLLSLDDSEKVSYSRPSIDVTFQSAAHAFGVSVVGILLSGANADGTEGMADIRRTGGLTIVQLPESAEMPFMPMHAIERQLADRVYDVSGIAAFLNDL